MTYNNKLLLLLAIIVYSFFGCNKREQPLYLYTYEYELNLPQKYGISTAKWSPNGDKILILASISDDGGFSEKSFHFFIVDTRKKSSFEEVFSYPSENYGFLKFACWSTDTTFLFEAGKRSKGNGGYVSTYIIYKFNTLSRETTRVYASDNEIALLDANEHDFLFRNVSENVFYQYNSGGVLSLYEKSLTDNSKPIRLTALHPDTLLVLSSVNSARYVTDSKLVVEKTIVKSLSEYEPWIRRIELLNLYNGTHQLLKEYICTLEDLQAIGFEVSPSGEWLVYSNPIIPSYGSFSDTLKFLSIVNPDIERNLILVRGDKKVFSYWIFAFWAVDWSPKGDKILCLGMRKKTRETKLYIIELPKDIN